jgi:hypothetical protein
MNSSRVTSLILGPGPELIVLAWKQWCGAQSGQFYQLEHSQLMKQQARKLWDGLYPQVSMTQLNKEQSLPHSFLLFGHSANEMGVKEALNYIKQINPDHILFIEPGTKEFFPQMLEIRSALLKEDFNVLFPCPSSLDCPISDSANDWCHQFIQVQHSVDVERLTQIVKKDRRLLPLTVHAYSKTFKHNHQERIVRVHTPTKFSFEWDVCLWGRRLSVIRFLGEV